MHLLNEIFLTLLIYLRGAFHFLMDYLRALSGGYRQTTLVRLSAAMIVLGGLTVAASGQAARVPVLQTGLTAVGITMLLTACAAAVVAYPGIKRGVALVLVAICLVLLAAALVLADLWFVVLGSSLGILGAVIYLLDDRYLTGTIRGSVAEMRTAMQLKRFTGKSGALINSAIFQDSSHSTEVDHILINRAGVFVIETKGLSGVIAGRPEDPEWFQVLSQQVRNPFQNPLFQNEGHLDAVKSVVGTGIPVHGLVVFTNATFGNPMPPNVIRLKDLGRYMKSFKANAVSESLVATLFNRLEAARDSSRNARKEHLRRLASRRAAEYAD